MRFAVYAALLTALLGPYLLVRTAGRLRPRTAAYAITIGTVVCALAWLSGLVALAAVTLGQIRVVARFGEWSARSLEVLSPVPYAAGIVAALLLAFSLASVAVAARRILRSFSGLRRLRSVTGPADEDGYVVVRSSVPEAVTVPGWPGTVLVTSGMLDALRPEERSVLLAHERCHLEARHWAFQLTTRVAASLVPSGRRLAAQCDQALERWADETAARTVGDRKLVARTVAKAALLVTRQAAPGFGTGMADGVVVDRVQALLRPGPRTRPLWLALAVAVCLVTALTAGEAVRDAGTILELARRALG